MADAGQTPGTLSRRLWLKGAAGAWAVLSQTWGVGAGFAGDLIVRNRRPLDLETPVTDLGDWVTPNDKFFVRSHLGEPAPGLATWSIRVGGPGASGIDLSLADLERFERVTVPAVLQCSGNGRAYFRPLLPGVGWDRGAVGHAEWSGVRLADVLARVTMPEGTAHVHFLGADAPPAPKTPAYLRSLPLARALDPGTVLALGMNGVPLPHLHGGPVRLVVPTWSGNHWMKWVRSIRPSTVEAPGFYQQTGYRMPKRPAPPDAVLKPADLVPVTTLNVKSLITAPGEAARVSGASVEVRGVAWTGEGHVVKVEVATSGDPAWREAKLIDPPREGSWRRWVALVPAGPPGGSPAPRPSDRFAGGGPAGNDPLEQERVPVERDRLGQPPGRVTDPMRNATLAPRLATLAAVCLSSVALWPPGRASTPGAGASVRADDDDERAEAKLESERAVRDNCLYCHDASLIQAQRLTPKQWKAEVDKMLGWGSPLPAERVESVTAYLSEQYAATIPAAQAEVMTHAEAVALVAPEPPGAEAASASAAKGQTLFEQNCQSCHGPDAQGSDLGPSLREKPVLMRWRDFVTVNDQGRGRMPAFATLLDHARQADILAWLRTRTYPDLSAPGPGSP